MQSLSQLVSEVTRQSAARRDFVAPVPQLRMISNGKLALKVNGSGEFPVNEIGHQQIGEFTGIPRDYYKVMLATAPDLLATNVNRWFDGKASDKRLVRTLDGNVRAFLSERYRPLDNLDLMTHLVPVLMERPDLSFRDAEVTERRFYLKVVSDQLQGEVKAGDVVRMGLMISNSEVGMGALSIVPFSDRLVCSNGAVHTALGQRRAHLGRALGGDSDENVREYLSDETKAADDRAFYLKARDTVAAILSGDVLKGLLEDMRTAAGDKVEGDPAQVVETIGRNAGLNEGERTTVLRKLIEGADLSRWGVANAITAAAHESTEYDRAVDLQQLGGKYMSEPLPAIELKPERVKVKRRQLQAV